MIYKKYLVKENDHFEPGNYPSLVEEMDTITRAMALLPSVLNSEILISFLREHSISSEQERENPKFAEMMRSTSLPIKNLEALFDSSSHNPLFQKQLQEYIKSKAKEPLNLNPN